MSMKFTAAEKTLSRARRHAAFAFVDRRETVARLTPHD
jgi:hypothetical protein